MKLLSLNFLLITIILAVSVTITIPAQTIQPAPIDPAMLTDSNNDEDHNSAIATDGQGNWVAAWISIDTRSLNFYSIKTATSNDNGQTFSSPVELQPTPVQGTAISSLAIDVNENGTWILSWNESLTIFVSRSEDNGKTWTAKTEVFIDSSSQDIVAQSGNNWHILTITSRNKAARIISSNDNGLNWSGNTILGVASKSPKLMSDSAGNLYATWFHFGQVWAAFSSDNGNSWLGPKRVGSLVSSFHTLSQSLDSIGNWFIVWDGLEGVKSSDQGQNFSDLSLPSGEGFKYPELTIDEQDRITLGWISEEVIQNRLFFIRSTDAGVTWSGRLEPFDLTPFRENLQLKIKSGANNTIQCSWTAFYENSEPNDNDILYSQFDTSLFDSIEGSFDCYIDQNYRDILKRSAEVDGRQFYANLLEANVLTPEDFILLLTASDEFNNLDGFIMRALIALYNDDSKFSYDYRRYKIVSGGNLHNYRITIPSELAQGVNLQAAKEKLIDQLIESDEWQRRLGEYTNAEFVDRVLYKNILGRIPSQTEFATTVSQLNSKQTTWDKLIVQQIDSDEAKFKYENHVLVTSLFLNLLEFQTRRIDWEYWMNQLQTGLITQHEAVGQIIRQPLYRDKLQRNGCSEPY